LGSESESSYDEIDDRTEAGGPRSAIARAAGRAGPEDERLERAAPVASQVLGLVMMRYLWRIEPLAAMSDDDVVALIAPSLQRYLTGSLR
jgi:Tetracyclin repressor-like, C-terminal domain